MRLKNGKIKLLAMSVVAIIGMTLAACQPKLPKENNQPSADSQSTTTDSTTQMPDPSDMKLTPITILALGDSLTEGLGVASDANYPAQLQRALHQQGYKNVQVINSGLSGETSTGMINRLDWVAQTHPDITILTIGANDAIRGIDVAIVDKNIRTAIDKLQGDGSVIVLGGMQIYDNLGSDYVNAFSKMYPKIANDTGAALIPFFLAGVAADRKLNQADAIHPTAEGYKIVVNDNILPVLLPVIDSTIQQKQAQKNDNLKSTDEKNNEKNNLSEK